jgi:lysine-N-methylase
MNTKTSIQADTFLRPVSSEEARQHQQAGRGADQPSYAAKFQCIGESCEDSCCSGWNIPLDRGTYDRYQAFQPDKLGSIVSRYVSITPVQASPSFYAQINVTPEGACPFFQADRLCAIQKEYGGQLLSATCSIYPRTLNQVEGALEGSLMLSCPEAARNILLSPDSTRIEGNLLSGDFRTDNVFYLASGSVGAHYKPAELFREIRACLIEMVQDRSRPMWQRLLLIGSLCKQLSEISAPTESSIVPAILNDYRQLIGSQLAHVELEQMPSHPEAKLKIVLKLTDRLSRSSTCGPRFLDTCRTFVEGIGLSSDSIGGDDVARFQEAEKNYHRVFFEKYPFILENYLLNFMYKNLFPFGRTGSPRFVQRSIFDEYMMMAIQFGWINGLLIGIAGRYKENFSAEHIVKAIQSFSREVEHDPSILTTMGAFMNGYGLDNLQGMAILLKS